MENNLKESVKLDFVSQLKAPQHETKTPLLHDGHNLSYHEVEPQFNVPQPPVMSNYQQPVYGGYQPQQPILMQPQQPILMQPQQPMWMQPNVVHQTVQQHRIAQPPMIQMQQYMIQPGVVHSVGTQPTFIQPTIQTATQNTVIITGTSSQYPLITRNFQGWPFVILFIFSCYVFFWLL